MFDHQEMNVCQMTESNLIYTNFFKVDCETRSYNLYKKTLDTFTPDEVHRHECLAFVETENVQVYFVKNIQA